MKLSEIKTAFINYYKVSLYISENDNAFFPDDFKGKDLPFCELEKNAKLISKKMSLSLYEEHKERRVLYFGSSEKKAEGDFFVILYGEEDEKID